MIIMYFLFLDDQRFPAGQVFGPVGKDSATFFAFPANNFPPAVFASSLSKMGANKYLNLSTGWRKARSLSEVRAIIFTPVLN
jgi:hypothetical protein